MHLSRIGFIGCGNMARSLIGGMIEQGFDPKRIRAYDLHQDALAAFAQHAGIYAVHSIQALIETSDVLVLAVKPQNVKEVCGHAAHYLTQQQLIISIAAGIHTASIAQWLNAPAISIVRAMPNTPAFVGTGATGLYANGVTSERQKELAEHLMRSVGVTVWLQQESLIDAVTAISGSGPAYFFLFMQALQASGEALGLDEKTARLLTLQTALGAAKMAFETADSLEGLRLKVTSPKGTTERAIETFQQQGLEDLIAQATRAAYDRARELGQMLGDA
jgi:pyrroline-5-carboxylate reductase